MDAGTQTLVDAGVQTDPVEFASAGSSAPATVANATSSTQQRPRLAGPPVQLQDKVQFKDASKPDASTPANGVSRDDGKATRNSMTNASGGLKGLFRRLSRSRSNKNRDEDSTTRSNRLSASNKGSARTADAANWMPGQATAASQITTDDAKSMVTLDSMWVKKPKSSKKRSTHPVGPAFHLYHENGVHDSLYPSASESTTQKAPESHTSAFALYHSTGHHTTLYPEATSVPDERKELDVEDSFLPPAIPMKSHRRLGLAPASDAVAERELTSTA